MLREIILGSATVIGHDDAFSPNLSCNYAIYHRLHSPVGTSMNMQHIISPNDTKQLEKLSYSLKRIAFGREDIGYIALVYYICIQQIYLSVNPAQAFLVI